MATPQYRPAQGRAHSATRRLAGLQAHPDVVARLRRRGEDEDEADRWCDEIVTDAPIHRLLEAADEYT
jgi:capsule polysaccharide export protein KpsC/LpsZ